MDRINWAAFTMVGLLVCLPVHALPGTETCTQAELPAHQDGQLAADDAAGYAKQHAVPLAEAERRLRLETRSGDVASLLGNEFKDRLAGMFVEHRPTYRIVVRLTGSSPVKPRLIRIGNDGVPVVFMTGASATRQQLADIAQENTRLLQASIPDLQGIGIDETTGEIVLTVYAPGRESKAYTPEIKMLTSLLGNPMRIHALRAREQKHPATTSPCPGLTAGLIDAD